MLIGFFIGAFIGTFFGGWSPLILGCAGALFGLTVKWEKELAPYKARERRREAAKRRSAKTKSRRAKIAGGSALATTAVASQWPSDDSGVTDDLFSLVAEDDSAGIINPATGLPMLNSCFDAGGNAFGCSSDDWDSTNTHDTFSDSSFDDSNTFENSRDSGFDDSFSSFNDDW